MSIKSFLRYVDIYPQKITLTFNGETDYKTAYGGVLSILTVLPLIIYSIFLTVDVFNYEGSKKEVNTLMRDLSGSSKIFKIGEENFRFGIKFHSSDPNISWDPSYINMSFIQRTYSIDDSPETVYHGYGNRTEMLGHQECGHKFDVISEEIRDRFNLPTFTCPHNDSYYVKGTPVSQEYVVVGAEFIRCNNNTYSGTCKTNEEIDNFMKKTYIEMALLNTYFDFEDYDNPIKTFLEGFNVYRLIPGIHQAVDIKVVENEAVMNDDRIMASETKREKYYSVGDKTTRLSTEEADNSLLYIFFNISQESITSTRTVASILDMLGQIGGVSGLLFMFGGCLGEMMATSIFHNEVFKNIYHLKDSQCDDPNSYESNSDEKNLSDIEAETPARLAKFHMSSVQADNEELISDDIQIKYKSVIARNVLRTGPILLEISEEQKEIQVDTEEDGKIDREEVNENIFYSKINQQNENVDDQLEMLDKFEQEKEAEYYRKINEVKEEMLSRRRFSFTNWQVLIAMFPSWSIRCCLTKKKKHKVCESTLPMNEYLNYYNTGVNKFNRELDCVEIVDSIRILKTLISIIITGSQSTLADFANSKLLDRGEDTSERKNSLASTREINIPKIFESNPERMKTFRNEVSRCINLIKETANHKHDNVLFEKVLSDIQQRSSSIPVVPIDYQKASLQKRLPKKFDIQRKVLNGTPEYKENNKEQPSQFNFSTK